MPSNEVLKELYIFNAFTRIYIYFSNKPKVDTNNEIRYDQTAIPVYFNDLIGDCVSACRVLKILVERSNLSSITSINLLPSKIHVGNQQVDHFALLFKISNYFVICDPSWDSNIYVFQDTGENAPETGEIYDSKKFFMGKQLRFIEVSPRRGLKVKVNQDSVSISKNNNIIHTYHIRNALTTVTTCPKPICCAKNRANIQVTYSETPLMGPEFLTQKWTHSKLLLEKLKSLVQLSIKNSNSLVDENLLNDTVIILKQRLLNLG